MLPMRAKRDSLERRLSLLSGWQPFARGVSDASLLNRSATRGAVKQVSQILVLLSIERPDANAGVYRCNDNKAGRIANQR
jgi:hypothetical protein